MRLFLFVFLCVSVVGASASETPSASVSVGQSQEDVRKTLGKPFGEVRKGNRIVWMYPKGTVEFEAGRVVGSSLLSDDAYAKAEVKKAQEAEKRRQETARAPVKPVPKPVKPEPQPPVKRAAPAATERFVRPFVRPTFSGVQCYNNIPVVFEMTNWPPAMRKIYDASVEIPVALNQRKATYDTLVYELKKYPDEMLEQTLRCIYMIRNLRGEGKDMDPGALAFYTEGIVLEHTCYLHHEYAHELNYLFANVFPEKELEAVSGPYKGIEGYRERRILFQKDLWNLGYTSNYGMCNVHEDFAEICEELYLQPLVFFRAIREHPKLAAKFVIARGFLEMVKTRTTGNTAPMDEAYFSRFDRSRWRP